MSYNLYVTRREFWRTEEHENPKADISKKSFIEFVKQHEKMELTDSSYSGSDGVAAVFHPTGKGDIYDNLSIRWNDGVIQSDMQMVPREVLQLLLEIADKVHAKVQGEDGEDITEADIPNVPTMDELTEQQNKLQEQYTKISEERKKTKRRRKTRLIITLVVIVLIIILAFLAPAPKPQEPTVSPWAQQMRDQIDQKIKDAKSNEQN